jgi:hypothetical protein
VAVQSASRDETIQAVTPAGSIPPEKFAFQMFAAHAVSSAFVHLGAFVHHGGSRAGSGAGPVQEARPP